LCGAKLKYFKIVSIFKIGAKIFETPSSPLCRLMWQRCASRHIDLFMEEFAAFGARRFWQKIVFSS